MAAGHRLRPLDEVQDWVLEGCPPLEAVTVPLASALGCVLAAPVVATGDVPPFANSAMDGYAVRAADTPGRLQVVGTVAAGDAATVAVQPGQALRIMTGAPFPPGADAIVMVERTTADGDHVVIEAQAQVGDHVRPAGEDLSAGTEVFAAGTALGPGHVGVLATAGQGAVTVVRRPVVGVLSTGDELVEPGSPLGPGQIVDSNRLTLMGLLRRDGFEAVDLGIARDDEALIRTALLDAAGRCDAVLTSGGVSMGAFDFVRKVLEEVAAMAWVQVAIRPAKPFAFGHLAGTPVFGLPGNPVSSMVSYELLARPALRRMAGHPPATWRRSALPAVADEPFRRRDDGRINLLRIAAAMGDDGRLHVRSAGGQGSNLLWPMAMADGLAVVPSGPGVEAGGPVEVLLLDSLRTMA